MGSDKPRASVRRPRVLARPQLPEGPLKHLKEVLYQLYLDAGTPSLDQIASWIAADDALPGAPERDTIRRCLGAAELPANQHDVTSIAAVLAREARWDPDEAQARVRSLWVSARMVSPLGRPVGEFTDPLALMVHPVINIRDAPVELPVYLPRRHDNTLRALLRTAEERPSMTVIVGGSSTGKTRAAYEAVRDVLPDWNLYHPIAPSKPEALIAALGSDRLAPKTVLWLDELREYLLPAGGEEAAAYLHDFLQRSGTLTIVATIWPDDWDLLTTDPTQDAPAPYPQARDLLRSLAHRVDIDATFDREQLEEAMKNDSRLRQAYDSTERHDKITQYLAAAFALTEWYNTIYAKYPAAWAIIAACMDAHRLGSQEPVSEEFLTVAAPRYLTRDTWGVLHDDWLSEALRVSTRTLRGAARPLTRIRPYPDEEPQPVRYQLADYLAEHGRMERRIIFPAESFWHAAVEQLDDPDAQVRLGYAAERRGRLWYAALLGKSATRATDSNALRFWAGILWSHGDQERSEEFLKKAASFGDAEALDDWAHYLSGSGNEGKVTELYEEAARAGEQNSLRRLAHYLWEHGERQKAEEFYARAVEAGDAWARWWWAVDLEDVGEHDRIVELCEEDATGAPLDLSLWWIPTLFKAGRAELAEGLIAELAASQQKEALWRWAECLWERDRKRAEELFQQAVDAGDEHALRRWAGMLERAGDFTRAKEVLLQAAASGDDAALWWLGDILWRHGLQSEALEFFVRAANAGCWGDVAREWAEGLREIGAVQEAERLMKFGLTCDGDIAEPWALVDLETNSDL